MSEPPLIPHSGAMATSASAPSATTPEPWELPPLGEQGHRGDEGPLGAAASTTDPAVSGGQAPPRGPGDSAGRSDPDDPVPPIVLAAPLTPHDSRVVHRSNLAEHLVGEVAADWLLMTPVDPLGGWPQSDLMPTVPRVPESGDGARDASSGRTPVAAQTPAGVGGQPQGDAADDSPTPLEEGSGSSPNPFL
ncbi:MAG: hypothetical protein ACK5O2_11440 [Microthrixaceae bacterium]